MRFRSGLLFIAMISGFRAQAADTVASRVEVGAGYSSVQAERDQGNLMRVRGAYRVNEAHATELEVKSLTRVFGDGTRIQDNGATLGVISKMTKRSYIENRVFVAPDAKILPQWSAQSVPFFSLPNNFEVGTGATYSHYLLQDVFTLSPVVMKIFEPNWIVGVRADITRTFNTIGAGQVFAQHTLLQRLVTRLTLATGRSVEDTALQADFNSVSVSARYLFNAHYSIELVYADYASDIRKEKTYGIGFGWSGR